MFFISTLIFAICPLPNGSFRLLIDTRSAISGEVAAVRVHAPRNNWETKTLKRERFSRISVLYETVLIQGKNMLWF